jgi:hypothetical protein
VQGLLESLIFLGSRIPKMNHLVGFEVLTAARVQTAVVCVAQPCGLVELYCRFRVSCRLIIRAIKRW